MPLRRPLPFQLLMTLRVTALVLVFTGVFLWIVLGRMQRQAEATGREAFVTLAHSSFGDLDAIAGSYLLYLDTLARVLPASATLDSPPATASLAQSLLGQPGPQELALVLSDDRWLVIHKRHAEAPTGTAYTLVRPGAGVRRNAQVELSFHASDGSLLGTRRAAADPRPGASDWYRGARRTGTRYLSATYRLDDPPQLNTVLAQALADGVVALTTPLAHLDPMLDRVALSRNGAVVLLDDAQHVVSLRTRGDDWDGLSSAGMRLRPLAGAVHPALAQAAAAMRALPADRPTLVTLAGREFILAWHTVIAVPGTRYDLLLMAPLDDLAGAARGSQRAAWLVALGVLAFVLPLTWFGAGAVARMLQRLVQDSQRIERLDFAAAPALASTGVREVDALAQAHDAMRGSLAARTRALQRVSDQLGMLVGIGMRLVQERDRQALLRAVLDTAQEFTGARSAILFVREEDDLLSPQVRSGMALNHMPPTLDLKLPRMASESLAVHSALHGSTSVVDDFASDTRSELATLRRFLPQVGYEIRTLVSLPLRTPAGRVVGVMQVFNATDPGLGQVMPFTPGLVRFLEALAAQAAVALENHQLLMAQRQVMDALVRMLGGAIDAKSPYTGRHCQRVPELAMMLARKAHETRSGPLAGFGFHSEEEWREFRIGAWLHDCGKITSPEHVIDKATKLETVHNRLHEVRTRFEVLLRDARIDALLAERSGLVSVEQATALLARRTRELQDDFAFIADCNLGSEKMAAEDIARVHAIAGQGWLRHFDDRIGISHDEQLRHRGSPAPALPVREALLADLPWHEVPRDLAERSSLVQGFRMQVPELRYNHGELHNLCVERGTLTREERFKVNEHIIHTIRMLEEANFPANLRRVPEYAGTHHETLAGTGYPRALTAAQLSIPARIMAIADIFEALTAADRPYKRAKTLSESIAILHGMSQRGHIDPDLFELFLRERVYLSYAEHYLAPEQIDEVDVARYLAP